MKKFDNQQQDENNHKQHPSQPPNIHNQMPNSQNYYAYPPQYHPNLYDSPQTGLFHNFLQRMINNQQQPPYSNHENYPFNYNSCYENMIQSLFTIVEEQNKSLQNLSLKVQQISDKALSFAEKLKKVQNEKNNIQKSYHILSSEKKHKSEPENFEKLKFSGEQINSEQLIEILFSKTQYDYSLQLNEEMVLPLFRERNFNLKIKLVNQQGQQIKNQNKIPMSIGIYTCENPPKFLEKNTSGQKMLKGYTEQAMINGECLFEKIQIRQVTSHYREGWIYVVIIPCMTPLGSQKSQNFVDFEEIKPLVISNVVVKAKKPKKKNEEISSLKQKRNAKKLNEDDQDENS